MVNQKSPIGYAVVGLGTWGELHLNVMKSDPRINLLAVCDINKEKAEHVAKKFGIPQFYDSYNEMLLDQRIKAVSVATPDFAHAEVAIAAAQSGRSVLIEKPMATTVENCLDIIHECKKNNVKLMVDFHNRWNPSFYVANEKIRAKELGKIKYVYFRLSDTIFVPQSYISWSSKSSVLWFLGPHVTDTLRWLFQDEVKEVYCVSRKDVLLSKGIDTPDFFTYILQFENGGVATVEHSWILSDKNPTIFDLKCEIQCADGTIFIDTSHNRTIEIYSRKETAGWENIYPDIMLSPVINGKLMGFGAESIRHFIDCLWEGTEPLVGGIDGLRSVEILLAALESSACNSPVKVNRNHL